MNCSSAGPKFNPKSLIPSRIADEIFSVGGLVQVCDLSVIFPRTSFLIALENNKKLIGGGLFLCSRDECEYSTAAYDRNLFDKPIGHLVQKMAIKKMIDRGIKWYRIGDKALETNEIKPTEKDYSISLFKEGFSSNIFPINKTHFYFDSDKINEK